MRSLRAVLLTVSFLIATTAAIQSIAEDSFSTVQPGHSSHGEVFNEGPRQKAYLMSGMPKIQFASTTSNESAKKFINQGVGQLHGFWYFEAERSFRQAAALDPQCAIAYWGMAMANIENEKRAKGFIAEADKHKAGASERERLYIEAFHSYFTASTEKGKDRNKERSEKLTRDLEKLLFKYPDDLDAKTWLALQLWKNRKAGIQIQSYLAVDALLGEVFLAEPTHPGHHYRIHLWDDERAEKAVGSAAVDGQVAAGIAHMWHMSGHIFSKLKRYDDAAWQQEASARVDHAHMMRDRVLPDQIHNFAHNNEWLIRDLSHIGRVRHAIDLAKNMTELPRHPKYNTLEKQGSAFYGRMRLFELLSLYESWDELIALAATPYLEPTGKESEQVKRLRQLGAAYFRKGDRESGQFQLSELDHRLTAKKQEQDKAGHEAETKAKESKKPQAEIDKSKKEARKTYDAGIQELEKAIAELEGHDAVAAGNAKEALPLFKKAGNVNAGFLAEVQLLAGEKAEAEKAARAYVNTKKSEVQPLAVLADILWQLDKKKEAEATFKDLREISGHIDNMSLPAFARLAPMAKELSLPADWRIVKPPKPDVGIRPDLDSLGPFRWSPTPAPSWTLVDADGKPHSSTDYHGKPVVVMFYLGYGCLHCAEQLQAFGPKTAEFADAGITLLAISSDNQQGLKASIEGYTDGQIPFLLLSNSNLDIFRAFRCFDDFENKVLHGTFLLDGDGQIRWQDIGFEPFKDPTFVLNEAKRLLRQSSSKVDGLTAK